MADVLTWRLKSYRELVIDELYEILNLRARVFVVEQNAAYLDLDYKDQLALHLSGYLNGRLMVYCRLFKAGDYFDEACIGRVVADSNIRGLGYGHQLVARAVDLIESEYNENVITISAQLYLKDFYGKHGFKQISEVYLEDGLPHIRMRRG